jgi:hypothetical protein
VINTFFPLSHKLKLKKISTIKFYHYFSITDFINNPSTAGLYAGGATGAGLSPLSAGYARG